LITFSEKVSSLRSAYARHIAKVEMYKPED